MGDLVRSLRKYERGWTGGLPETPCGSGSKRINTVIQRGWLKRIVKGYDIHTVADIGAGDLNWIGLVGWKVDYTAYDLVPRSPTVIKLDIVREIPPKVDALMLLWVLNHFPPEDSIAAIKNIRASGSKWLIVTDRPIWHDDHPQEFLDLIDGALETVVVNKYKKDCIKLVRL